MKLSPSIISKITNLFNVAKSNPTLVNLFYDLDGATTAQAYKRLRNLSDEELRLLAALIGLTNKEFER